MTSKQQRIAVIKALKAAQKNPPKGGIEELADSIVGELEAFEEAFLEGGLIVNPASAPPPQPSRIVLATESTPLPQSAPEPETDIFRRTGVAAPMLSGDELTAVKVKMVDDFRVTLPQEISVTPPGFSTPLVLFRHTVAAAPGEMSYVEVDYAPAGATTTQQLVRTFVDANSPRSAETVIKEISDTAVLQFSAVPKHVRPRSAGPPQLANWGTDSLSDKIDKDLPATAPANWMNTKGEVFKL